GDIDNFVRVWDLHTGKECFRFQLAGAGWLTGLAFSSDGRLIAVSSSLGPFARVLSLGERRIVSKPDVQENLVSLAISPDRQSLVGCRPDGAIVRWELKTGKALTAKPMIQQAMGGFFGARAKVLLATFFADEKGVVTGNRDGTVRILDLPEERERLS